MGQATDPNSDIIQQIRDRVQALVTPEQAPAERVQGVLARQRVAAIEPVNQDDFDARFAGLINPEGGRVPTTTQDIFGSRRELAKQLEEQDPRPGFFGTAASYVAAAVRDATKILDQPKHPARTGLGRRVPSLGPAEKALLGTPEMQAEMARFAESATTLEKGAGEILGMATLPLDPYAWLAAPFVGPLTRPILRSPAFKGMISGLGGLMGPRRAAAVEGILSSGVGVGAFSGVSTVMKGPLPEEDFDEFVGRIGTATGHGFLFGSIVFGIPLGAFRAATLKVQAAPTTPREVVKIVDGMTPAARTWLKETATPEQAGAVVRRREAIKNPIVRRAYDKEVDAVLAERGTTRAEVIRKIEEGEAELVGRPIPERGIPEAEIQRLTETARVEKEATELRPKAEERLAELEIVREETGDLGFLVTELRETHTPAELEPAFRFWKRAKKQRDLTAGLGEAVASRVLTQEAFLRDLSAGTADAKRAVTKVRRGDVLDKGEPPPSLTFGELRRELKIQKKSSKGLRDEAKRLVRQTVPRAGQPDLITSINNADTVVKLANALAHAKRVVERVEKKQALTRFKGVLKRAKRRKLHPRYDKVIKEIDAEFDAKNLSENLQGALTATAEFLELHPDAPVSKKTLERLKRLDKTSLKKLSAEEVNALTDAMRLALRLNALRGKLVGLRRGREQQALGDNIEAEIDLRVPRKPLRHTPIQRVRGDLPTRARRSVSSLVLEEFSTRPEVLLESLSPELAKLVWEEHGVQGYRTESRNLWEFRDDFNALAEALGLPTRGILNPKFEKWRRELVEVEGVGMSRGEAVMLELLFRNPQSRTELIENGYTLDRTDQKHEFTRLNTPRLRHTIGDEALAFSNHMFDSYNGKMKELLNRPWVRVYGHEVATRVDHVPTNPDMTRTSTGKSLQELSQLVSATVSSWGALKPKLGTKAPLKIRDAFDVYFNHVDHVSRINAYLESTQNAMSVLGLENVKQAIIDTRGEVGLARIESAIKHQAVRTVPGSPSEQTARRLLRQAGASVLGLRASTMVMNPAGLAVTAAYVRNGAAILARASKAGVTPAEWRAAQEFMLTHAPDMRSRYYDFASASTAGLVTQRTSLGRPSIAELSLVPLQVSDFFGSVIRLRMSKIVVEEQLGIKPTDPRFNEEVASEWTRMTFRGENTGVGIELTGALAFGRSNVVFTPTVMFSSSQSKLFSVAMRGQLAARRSLYQEKLAKEAEAGGNTGAAEALRKSSKAARRLAVGGLAAFAAGTAWVVATRVGFRNAEGRGRGKPASEQLIKQGLSEVISNIPFVGEEIIEPAVRLLLTGDQSRFAPGTIVESFTLGGIETITKAYDFTQALINEELNAAGEPVAGEKLLKLLDSAADFAVLPLGIPYSGPKSLVRIGRNILGGKTKSDRAIIRDALKPDEERPDLTQPKRRLLGSLQEADEKAFRRAVLALPEEDRTRGSLIRILRARYSGLLNADKKVELDEEGQKALRGLKAEVALMRRNLDDFIQANPDVLRGGR